MDARIRATTADTNSATTSAAMPGKRLAILLNIVVIE
jgi:hypothetical protein